MAALTSIKYLHQLPGAPVIAVNQLEALGFDHVSRLNAHGYPGSIRIWRHVQTESVPEKE